MVMCLGRQQKKPVEIARGPKGLREERERRRTKGRKKRPRVPKGQAEAALQDTAEN